MQLQLLLQVTLIYNYNHYTGLHWHTITIITLNYTNIQLAITLNYTGIQLQPLHRITREFMWEILD